MAYLNVFYYIKADQMTNQVSKCCKLWDY